MSSYLNSAIDNAYSILESASRFSSDSYATFSEYSQSAYNFSAKYLDPAAKALGAGADLCVNFVKKGQFIHLIPLSIGTYSTFRALDNLARVFIGYDSAVEHVVKALRYRVFDNLPEAFISSGSTLGNLAKSLRGKGSDISLMEKLSEITSGKEIDGGKIIDLNLSQRTEKLKNFLFGHLSLENRYQKVMKSVAWIGLTFCMAAPYFMKNNMAGTNNNFNPHASLKGTDVSSYVIDKGVVAASKGEYRLEQLRHAKEFYNSLKTSDNPSGITTYFLSGASSPFKLLQFTVNPDHTTLAGRDKAKISETYCNYAKQIGISALKCDPTVSNEFSINPNGEKPLNPNVNNFNLDTDLDRDCSATIAYINEHAASSYKENTYYQDFLGLLDRNFCSISQERVDQIRETCLSASSYATSSQLHCNTIAQATQNAFNRCHEVNNYFADTSSEKEELTGFVNELCSISKPYVAALREEDKIAQQFGLSPGNPSQVLDIFGGRVTAENLMHKRTPISLSPQEQYQSLFSNPNTCLKTVPVNPTTQISTADELTENAELNSYQMQIAEILEKSKFGQKGDKIDKLDDLKYSLSAFARNSPKTFQKMVRVFFNLKENATWENYKEIYKFISQKTHPDKNDGNQNLQKIYDATQLLHSVLKKGQYDTQMSREKQEAESPFMSYKEIKERFDDFFDGIFN